MTLGTTLPPDLVSTILARIRAGETQAAVAADLDLSRHTVSRYARMHGLARKRADPKPATPPQLQARDDLSWMDRAECSGWPGWDKMTTGQQKKFCIDCVVRQQCLERGLRLDEERWQVYGGLTPRELQRLRKLRKLRAERFDLDKLRAEVAS